MTPQQFSALAAIAAVTLTTAVVLHAANSPWSVSQTKGGLLVASLKARSADVASIEISQGGETVTLARDGVGWVLKNRDGFPAAPQKVRALLIGLSEAELLEAKTRSADRYALLELEDPKTAGSRSRLIRVLDASGGVIAEAIAGKTRRDTMQGVAGTYVRRPNEAQAWLANTAIEGDTSLAAWTQARVLEIATEKISKVTISIAGQPSYEIKREGSEHRLVDLPQGKKLKFVNLVDNIIEAVSYLDFVNVRKGAGDMAGEAGSAAFETDTGLKVTMRLRKDKDVAWARLDVSGEGAAKATADEIRARTADWEFQIAPGKLDTILKRRDDMLEDGLETFAPMPEGGPRVQQQ